MSAHAKKILRRLRRTPPPAPPAPPQSSPAPAATFAWNGQELGYFDHPYNRTALNSRRVEVPLARWFLKRAPAGTGILEIGNVLAHYGPISWPVVDRRESGCLNVDVMQWRPDQPVELLLCISTLEHIGFGKYAQGGLPSYEPATAWAQLCSFLAPGGQLLVTVPLAYNPALDAALQEGAIAPTTAWYMRKMGQNQWVECAFAVALAESARACAGRWPGGLAILYWEAKCPRSRSRSSTSAAATSS